MMSEGFMFALTRWGFILSLGVFLLSMTTSYQRFPDTCNQKMIQRTMILVVHFFGNFIFMHQNQFETEGLIVYGIQVAALIMIFIVMDLLFGKGYAGFYHVTIMLCVVGVLMVTRLSPDNGLKQAKFIALGYFVAFVAALFFQYIHFFDKLILLYFALSIGFLLIANTTSGGANNWFTLGNITFQPSEVSKLFYLMFLGAFFIKPLNHRRLVVVALASGLLLLVFVYQKDLGGALLFYLTFITLIYLASNKLKYLLAGLLAGGLGAWVGHLVFYHVRVRVLAWQNPFDYIDYQGYQITQGLFAISAGGWFGQGFTKGMPKRIPVVVSDFIYAAIAEEFGNLFAIGLLLLYLFLFLMICKVAIAIEDTFDMIVLFGIGIMHVFQTFLIVGGVIKLIPVTGVTMPLISYGGSSIVMVLLMMGVVQGITMKHHEAVKAYYEVDDDA